MVYKTIYDCPIKIFHRVGETKDYNLFVYETISEAVKGEIQKPDNLSVIYESMQDAIIDKFGVSEKIQTYIYKQRDVDQLELDVLSGDRSQETMLNIYKIELESFKNELLDSISDEMDKDNARLRRIVEQEYGINIEKCTVFEFYTCLEDMKIKNREMMVTKLRKVS
jgi:hypothetical protein